MISRIITINFDLNKDYIKLNPYFNLSNLGDEAYNTFMTHLDKKISKDIYKKLSIMPNLITFRTFTLLKVVGYINLENIIKISLTFIFDGTANKWNEIKDSFITSILSDQISKLIHIEIEKSSLKI